MSETRTYRAGILHGGGYAGGELLRLLLAHPHVTPAVITSRTYAGKPVWTAHTALRGATELVFSDDGALEELLDLDVVLVSAEHGKSAATIVKLLDAGYEGAVVDLSADFRFRDPAAYESWFGFTHPAPDLIDRFQYGIPEIFGPYPAGTRFVANPGCFASAITFGLWPLASQNVTATV
ncbi:MAG TPA: N-acetyl-gamma-glutamyl-phosphate reductase, partial [Rhodothermales bacterium]